MCIRDRYSDTWGAPGSGADHETALISGTGKLLVVPSEYIWTNTGSDGKWATALNWNVSQIPTTGVLLRFPSATDTSMVNDLPDLASVGKLRFESDAPAYTISGSNTLGITQGIENLSANIQTLGFPISLQAITQFTTSAGEILLNGNISGNYGFSKLGSGVLALAGTNTYTGNIGISGGTLATLAADALPPTSTVAFTNTTGTAGLDLTGRTQTLSGLTFGTQTTGTNTVTITGNSSTSLTVSPATLTFAPLNSASNLTVNMSSLGTFTYNNTGGTLNINGGSSAITSTGHFTTLTLPTTANNITALNLNVGNSGSSNGVAVSTLNLGTTANLNVTNLGIGNSNSRASGTLKAGSGTLTIRGATGGTSAATLTLGSSDSYQVSDTTTAVFDASAGTLDALFSDVTIGRDVFGGAARGVTINATLKMGAGSISANTLTLANLGGTYTGAGSYSITSLLDLNGTGTTTVTNLKLAHNSSITSPATVVLNSQVNLNGGATLKAAYVQQGTVTGVTTLTSRINWANGTIANIPGGDLTISGVAIVLGGTATHAFDISAGQTATVSAAISSLSGSTPLTKSGSGTLTLSGPNTYVGTTTVAAGTLETTTPFFDDASAVEIAAAAVLKLSFSGTDIVGSLTINGVPMTSGTTYGATGSGAAVIDNIHFSGTAKLQVGLIIDPFISWIGSSAFGLATADQGKTQDPDGDGLNNLLEFAIDGNPASGASSGKVVTKIDDSHLTLTLPIRDGASFTGGGPLVSATIDALVYMIEGDDDLSGFTSGVEEITALATGLPLLDKGWSYRTFRLTSTVNSAPRGFIRAGVSSAP